MTDQRLPRIWVDFAKQDRLGRLKLTIVGAREDIERLGSEFRDGLKMVGHDDELAVEGIVQYNAEENIWVLEFDPAAVRQDTEAE